MKRDTNRSAPNIPSLAPLVTRHTQKLEYLVRSILEARVFHNIDTSLVTQPMHASFSFHHLNLQLAYTTQAWNFKIKKNLCHASKHMKCTFKCINQVYELAPHTCVLKF